jgi:hypothetical protein
LPATKHLSAIPDQKRQKEDPREEENETEAKEKVGHGKKEK